MNKFAYLSHFIRFIIVEENLSPKRTKNNKHEHYDSVLLSVKDVSCGQAAGLDLHNVPFYYTSTTCNAQNDILLRMFWAINQRLAYEFHMKNKHMGQCFRNLPIEVTESMKCFPIIFGKTFARHRVQVN